jgi:hypothetical protein
VSTIDPISKENPRAIPGPTIHVWFKICTLLNFANPGDHNNNKKVEIVMQNIKVYSVLII